MTKIKTFFKNETVLCCAALLMVATMFFVPPDREYIGYINFRVLGLLFSLMVVVCGLQHIRVLDRVASFLAGRCGNMRSLVGVLAGLCFFSSMVITNDVALITFVPLSISVLCICGGEKYTIYAVVLQTVAANMGSMLTPMGNPQNLYLADYYEMSVGQFFGATAPICAIGGVILALMLLYVKKDNIQISLEEDKGPLNKKLFALYCALGVLAVLSVFGLVPYYVTVGVTLVSVLIFDRKSLKEVDYFLLLTFVVFFIFVGNAARIDAVKNFFASLTNGRELFVGAALSQFISNVPAAVMLSSFTENGKALLLGVDIGGLGTPVASLASLISYRIYSASKGSSKGKYMSRFLLINFALLGVILLIATAII